MAVKYKDYYDVLGVSRGATDDQIRNAYRKLARKHHPDVNPGDKTAEEKFKEINEAYTVLSDPQKRKQYDTLGQNWKAGADFRPPPDWGSNVRVEYGDLGEDFGGFSDFFESMFGGGRRARGSGFARRGSDVETQATITLDEAHRGTSRSVSLRGPDGKPRLIRVDIPAGASDGETIRLPNEGEIGAGGGSSGDLFVNVRIEPHPVFGRLPNADLEVDLSVMPWEAALGGQARVPTIDGPVDVTIPPNTQTGQRLRLRGQGLRRRGGERGDQYVRTRIVNPPSLSPRQRELYERLAAESKK
jgi:curved DNA-binding protein